MAHVQGMDASTKRTRVLRLAQEEGAMYTCVVLFSTRTSTFCLIIVGISVRKRKYPRSN